MARLTKKQIAYWFSVIAVGIALGLALQFVRAWTEPTSSPPEGNVGAPINTGGLGQVKQGTLGLFSNNWNSLTSQAVNPDLVGLLVAGETRSDDFCLNSNLNKCLSSVGEGGGSNYVSFAGYSDPVKSNYGSKTGEGSVGDTYPGVQAMNYRCSSDFSGSRICMDEEVILLWVKGELTPLDPIPIIFAGNIIGYTPVYAWVEPGTPTSQDCYDWRADRGGVSGTILRWSMTSEGGFSNIPIPTIMTISNCTAQPAQPIACCY